MNTKPIVWVDQQSRFGTGEDAKVGRIVIGSWHWNGIDSDPNKKYVAMCALPNIKSHLGKFATKEEAQQSVEKAFTNWIKEISSN